MTTPWRELPLEARKTFLNGSGGEEIKFVYDDGVRRYETKKAFEGVVPNLARRWKETDSAWIREELSRYQSAAPCPVCEGRRLKPEALSVKIAQHDISQVSGFAIRNAREWFDALHSKLNKQQNEIAVRILKEIKDRLRFLVDVGLDYLSLDRASGTLSGGESQRIRLASQIGSGLQGVLYVLDEPSIGLHQRDNSRLLDTLRRLRDLGNSVLVVEHDEEAILTADHVIDMGPAAGVHGGEIVSQGTPDDILADKNSLTGQYLSGRREIAVPEKRRRRVKDKAIKIVGASGNNLKSVTAEIPLGVMTCVTGVSGGGKSTLIVETLYKVAARRLKRRGRSARRA